jgi:hypothetical protein
VLEPLESRDLPSRFGVSSAIHTSRFPSRPLDDHSVAVSPAVKPAPAVQATTTTVGPLTVPLKLVPVGHKVEWHVNERVSHTDRLDKGAHTRP